MQLSNKKYRLSCDIGGTFTDFYLINQNDGSVDVEKCLTTPSDPSQGVFDGISLLAERHPDFLSETESVLHATTLVINAIIERKGARTALITTRGFRDVLEIGREMRYDLYDIFIEFPKPLVPRYLRYEVTERSYQTGNIHTPLDVNDLNLVVNQMLKDKVESIAICFLHSYANPLNEQLAYSAISELAPNIPVSISSDVLPEVREYERTTTTVANAYVRPLTSKYTKKLVAGLHDLGFNRQLLIMLSSGGMTSVETAAEFPVRIVESGPAAGAIAAAHIAKLAGFEEHVLAFDMGGTTAKGCVIQNGHIEKAATFESARVHRFKKGSGIPLRIPVIDIMEIGAGGGSIGRVDELGLIQVGPQSAGAVPGPACYGRGGIEPTVSDADLILGYLDGTHFLGGDMSLNKSLAKQAINNYIAKPLKLTLTKAAWGIHEIVTENMAAAIQIYMAEKGVDPARFTLVAFGGAGPVHAYALARRLGTHRILIPQSAGIASAFGLLVSPISFDLVKTFRQTINDLDLTFINDIFVKLEVEAKAFVDRAECVSKISFIRSFDICYLGQGFAVNVELPSSNLNANKLEIRDYFESVYKSLYGRVYPDMEIELINVRLVAQGEVPVLPKFPLNVTGSLELANKGSRKAYSGIKGKFIEFVIYDRYKLPLGANFNGPAIIEERESTTIIDTDGHVKVDLNGILVITLSEVKS